MAEVRSQDISQHHSIIDTNELFIYFNQLVGGGLLLTAKGVGKGVTQGDGKAVLNGIGDGAVSIGTGIVKGGESVVTGVGDGVFAVGKGIFKGVQNIGKGIGGAVIGKPPKSRKEPRKISTPRTPRRK